MAKLRKGDFSVETNVPTEIVQLKAQGFKEETPKRRRATQAPVPVIEQTETQNSEPQEEVSETANN